MYRSTFTTSWQPPVRIAGLSGGDTSDIAIPPDELTAVVTDLDVADRFRIHTRASTSVAFGAGTVHAALSGPGTRRGELEGVDLLPRRRVARSDPSERDGSAMSSFPSRTPPRQ